MIYVLFRWINNGSRCSILFCLIYACWGGDPFTGRQPTLFATIEMKNVLLGGFLLKVLFVDGTIIGSKTGYYAGYGPRSI